MATTATLTKDVIDLFEQKVELLEKQVAALETENKNLKGKVYDLEQEISRSKPKLDLEDDTIKALRLFFDQDLAVSRVAEVLGISNGKADYHCGVLQQRGMIELPMAFVMPGMELEYFITQKGREYLVKLGLA